MYCLLLFGKLNSWSNSVWLIQMFNHFKVATLMKNPIIILESGGTVLCKLQFQWNFPQGKYLFTLYL